MKQLVARISSVAASSMFVGFGVFLIINQFMVRATITALNARAEEQNQQAAALGLTFRVIPMPVMPTYMLQVAGVLLIVAAAVWLQAGWRGTQQDNRKSSTSI